MQKINNASPSKMHIDINSCFAAVEQQANPFLRNRPVAVVAYSGWRSCILAASVEAKVFGVKTGMRLYEAKKICPSLKVRESDPDKYRFVHQSLQNLLSLYHCKCVPKSIDEFVMEFPRTEGRQKLISIGKDIKRNVKKDVGDWLTVSIGIGTNRFWAKTASNFQKPDGLVLMDCQNAKSIYSKLNLTELHGISKGNKRRLEEVGIYTPLHFLGSEYQVLRKAFGQAQAYYWYMRIRGYEIDSVEYKRRSFGNTYSIPGCPSDTRTLSSILMKLAFKSSLRLRKSGYSAGRVVLHLVFRDGKNWKMKKKFDSHYCDLTTIYQYASSLLAKRPCRPTLRISLVLDCLVRGKIVQEKLEKQNLIGKRVELTKAQDAINAKWGKYAVFPAIMLKETRDKREPVGFGNIEI